MITNTLNGSFWTAYGLAVLDPFIYCPNGLGAALGVVQTVLILVFPRKSSLRDEEEGKREGATGEDDDNSNNDDKLESTSEMGKQPTKSDDLKDLEHDC
jgi:hypothetical protein